MTVQPYIEAMLYLLQLCAESSSLLTKRGYLLCVDARAVASLSHGAWVRCSACRSACRVTRRQLRFPNKVSIWRELSCCMWSRQLRKSHGGPFCAHSSNDFFNARHGIPELLDATCLCGSHSSMRCHKDVHLNQQTITRVCTLQGRCA